MSAFEHGAKHGVMLFRKKFRGRHQRRLKTVRHRKQHGVHGHGGFSAANIALQKSIHGEWLTHVRHNFTNHAVLLGSKHKWNARADVLVDLWFKLQRQRTRARSKLRAPHHDSKLQQE